MVIGGEALVTSYWLCDYDTYRMLKLTLSVDGTVIWRPTRRRASRFELPQKRGSAIEQALRSPIADF